MSAKTIPSKVLILICLMWVSATAFGQGFSSLEERMTGQEFADAGLEGLSAAELAKLNTWIRAHSLASHELTGNSEGEGGIASHDGLGSSADNANYYNKNPISSHLKGEFNGWDGAAVFELENGMIWVQDENDTFFIKSVSNPAVLIEPGMFSAWKLSVEGNNKKVRVKRIQ